MQRYDNKKRGRNILSLPVFARTPHRREERERERERGVQSYSLVAKSALGRHVLSEKYYIQTFRLKTFCLFTSVPVEHGSLQTIGTRPSVRQVPYTVGRYSYPDWARCRSWLNIQGLILQTVVWRKIGSIYGQRSSQ
jgi:hypothetical protein